MSNSKARCGQIEGTVKLREREIRDIKDYTLSKLMKIQNEVDKKIREIKPEYQKFDPQIKTLKEEMIIVQAVQEGYKERFNECIKDLTKLAKDNVTVKAQFKNLRDIDFKGV